jgi:hypothetical protein
MGRFLKFLNTLAQAFGQFGQLFGTEQNQNDRQDQNDFSAAEIEEG